MFEKLISNIADLSILIPFGVFGYRQVDFQSRTAIDKMILTSVLFTLIRNSITFVMAELGVYNIYIYNWYNLISFTLIAILYYLALQNRYLKFLSLIFLTASIITGLLDSDTLVDINTTKFNSFSFNSSGSFIIVLILSYFYELIQYLHVPQLKTYSLFWFSSGALFYYSGTIFPYVFISNTFNNLENRDQYWIIDALLSVIFSVFLALSVWYMKPTRMSK